MYQEVEVYSLLRLGKYFKSFSRAIHVVRVRLLPIGTCGAFTPRLVLEEIFLSAVHLLLSFHTEIVPHFMPTVLCSHEGRDLLV